MPLAEQPARSFWSGRPVLVTGHTGFKGSWLALWLHRLGARVHGLALPPSDVRGAYTAMRVSETLQREALMDISDAEGLACFVRDTAPEIVFHLAAQSSVATGYAEPIRTFNTNVLGTVNVLEGIRAANTAQAVVIVTSDKVYKQGGTKALTEQDPLGHHDPYSNSKACAELVVDSWRKSFATDGGPAIATARAGNVIGGGDSVSGRLLPDILAHLEHNVPVALRNPNGIRPWQHVLDVLDGYMRLARVLTTQYEAPHAVNFAPDSPDHLNVQQVVQLATRLWGGGSWVASASDLAETEILRLDSTLAREQLGWRSRLSVAEAVELAVAWHRALLAGDDLRFLALSQIADYEQRPTHIAGTGGVEDRAS